jgi:hypothetical protein
MSAPALVFLIVVLLVGLPSLFLNRTAAALVISWCVQETIALVTGENASVLTGLLLDYFVILVVIGKPEIRDCSPYPTMRHQVLALWCERSISDASVLTLFPIMWLVHAMNIDPYYRWWTLWGLALAQLLLAGAEALGPPLRRALVAFHPRVTPPPDLMKVAAGHA